MNGDNGWRGMTLCLWLNQRPQRYSRWGEVSGTKRAFIDKTISGPSISTGQIMVQGASRHCSPFGHLSTKSPQVMLFFRFGLNQAKACYNPRDGALVSWCTNLVSNKWTYWTSWKIFWPPYHRCMTCKLNRGWYFFKWNSYEIQHKSLDDNFSNIMSLGQSKHKALPTIEANKRKHLGQNADTQIEIER